MLQIKEVFVYVWGVSIFTYLTPSRISFLTLFLKSKYFKKIIKLTNIGQALLEKQLIPLEQGKRFRKYLNSFKPQSCNLLNG